MTIYIEMFLIQNALINFCLLRLIYLTTKTKSTCFKLVFASIIGAAFSVVSAVFITSNLALNIAKFACAICMILLAFKTNLKQFIFNFILLFLYTFAFGGAVTSISSNTYLTSFGAIITSKFSLEIICLILIILTYIFELIVKYLKFNIKANKLIYKITLYSNKNQLNLNAFLDTGNLLTHNNQPIIILDFCSYLTLSNNNLTKYFSASSITANTVSGINSLKLINIDKIIIHNGKQKITLENQQVAVTTNRFSGNNYNALLSPLMF